MENETILDGRQWIRSLLPLQAGRLALLLYRCTPTIPKLSHPIFSPSTPAYPLVSTPQTGNAMPSSPTELRYHHVCVGSEPIASSTAERNTTGDPNTGYTRGNPHPQPQTHTRQSRKREGRDRGAGVASLQSTARYRKGRTGHAQVLINGIGWAT
jgi:hypothetical protein